MHNLSIRIGHSNVAGCIVAGEGGEVDAGDGFEQPSSLPLLFDGATFGQRSCSSLDGAAIDFDVFEQTGIVGNTVVSF